MERKDEMKSKKKEAEVIYCRGLVTFIHKVLALKV